MAVSEEIFRFFGERGDFLGDKRLAFRSRDVIADRIAPHLAFQQIAVVRSGGCIENVLHYREFKSAQDLVCDDMRV